MENNFYVVRSYEGIYEGEQGVEGWFAVEGTLTEAVELARDSSFELMGDYSSITDSLWDRAYDMAQEHEDEYEDEYDNLDDVASEYYSELEYENVRYAIWLIHDSRDRSLIIEELDKDPEEYVEKYGELI